MKILALDIETSPALSYHWGLWDQNIGLNQVVEPTRVICFASKWLGAPGKPFWTSELIGRPDFLGAAWTLLDEAEAVMHWNGAHFDIPHLNREFLEAGMGPPSPYKQIDLMQVAKRQFKFMSNKLQYVSEALGLEGKIKHEGFELWAKCLDGDSEAWKRMKRYNQRDVELLEEAYEILKPWVPSHPNVRLYDGSGCPVCGADGAMQKRGFAYTGVSKFQQYQCQKCGAWSRGGKRLDGTDLRRSA